MVFLTQSLMFARNSISRNIILEPGGSEIRAADRDSFVISHGKESKLKEKKNDDDSVIKRRKLRIKTAVMALHDTFDDGSSSFFFSAVLLFRGHCK
jgi:hypothetical protein